MDFRYVSSRGLVTLLGCGGKKVTMPNGNVYYYNKKNMLHRDDGPAEITSFANTWYRNGSEHNIKGPSYLSKTGSTRWYVNGYRMDTWEQFGYESGIPMEELTVLIIANGWKMNKSYRRD